MVEMPEIVELAEIVRENRNAKTFYFNRSYDYEPGQFFMLWLPGLDEKPFSASYADKEKIGITVEKKGRLTQEMHKLEPGAKVGLRGPYGNPFRIKEGKACIIGGGCGLAPLMPLIGKLKDAQSIVGCQTKDALMFSGRLDKSCICTDDGSFGYKGFVTDRFVEMLKEERFDIVYTCGPEIMMRKVFEICQENRIECQASLERFMICGIGICGQCMCDSERVCTEGPVFGSKTLANLRDFGRAAMLKDGKKVPLQEYYSYRTKY